MMRRLYNLGGICYNNYAETNELRGLFFLPFSINTFIVNSAATLESPNLFVSATTDKAKKRLRLFFVQLNSRNEKVQVLRAPRLWKGFTYER